MAQGPTTRETPWSVSTLSGKLKDYLDRLGTVWVEGEITQWGVSGGNVYGKLKDLETDATVSFTMWSSVRARLSEQFKQGDHAVLLAKPSWWVKGGTLSMQVYDMKHVGLGDLLERLERLRSQLAAEGLFDPARKRPLPAYVGTLAVVTSTAGAAVRDIITVGRRRWPGVRVLVVGARVQGDGAVGELVRALKLVNRLPGVEV
ncbi:MAG TPA: exodeoxyribonuclease VII large subunit, partial [Microbacterium sp.]|nr:exodeoxyribonuclease VII large subunit [Microbacterium sp.]